MIYHPPINEIDQINRDLVMLVLRLSRQLPVENEWRQKAMDYIKRKKLTSPLR